MTEKETIIDGYKVRYGEQCAADASVLYVFLHGWGSDYTLFKPLCKLVDCALAFDFPGFGGSSPLREPWTLAKYAALLRSFIEKKVGDREVVFVAHSFGGRVLLQMLSQQSKVPWVRRVVCMGVPFVRRQQQAQQAMSFALTMAKGVAFLLPRGIRRAVRDRWCAMVGADDYAALDTAAMKKTFQNIISADMQYLAQSLRGYDTVLCGVRMMYRHQLQMPRRLLRKLAQPYTPSRMATISPFLVTPRKRSKPFSNNIYAYDHTKPPLYLSVRAL